MSRIFPSARGGAKPLFRLTLIVLTCAPVQALRAQEQSSAPVSLPEISVTAAPSAQPGSLNLTVPSTAGSRLNLTPLQTPASVSLIPGDQIRDQGDTTISEAESRAVGVTQVPFTGNGNNSLSARGFYGPNSITQLYDGMQLFNAGGVVAFPFDPWNVDRIEVLLGSSSTLYGTGGIGGAINVVPLQPDPTRQSEKFQSSYGSFGTVHAAADVTGPINQMVSYRFDVSQYKSDGWVQPDGGSSSLAISGVLRFELSPELVVTLRDDYGHFNPSDYEGTPILDGHVIDALRFINYNVSDGQVGVIGFVGLVAPHIARMTIGGDYKTLLPHAGLVGALLLLVADLIGRVAFAPIIIPVGIVVAFIGVPLFLQLLLTRRQEEMD
jgi:iron complex outermembrane receptor protein